MALSNHPTLNQYRLACLAGRALRQLAGVPQPLLTEATLSAFAGAPLDGGAELAAWMTDAGLLERLARGPASEPIYRPAARGRTVRRNPLILLAEDDPTLAAVVVSLLGDAGYTVVAVRNPIEAHILLRMGMFDLVLMEAFSPTWSLTARMLAPLLRRAGDTPVALLTEHDWSEPRAQAEGLAAIIQKPFNVSVLLRRVAELLRRDLALGA